MNDERKKTVEDTIWCIIVGIVCFIFGMLVFAGYADAQGSIIVQQGDTLSSIAARYGTTVTALKRANGLSDDMIFVGQRLRLSGTMAIPTITPKRRTYHIVKAGQAWYSIARRYGVTSWQLARYNGQRMSDTLMVGQRLNMPPRLQPTPAYSSLWHSGR